MRVFLAAPLAALLFIACSFDTAALDDLDHCVDPSDCPDGDCVAGFCIPHILSGDGQEGGLDDPDVSGDIEDDRDGDLTTPDVTTDDTSGDEHRDDAADDAGEDAEEDAYDPDGDELLCEPSVSSCVDDLVLEVCADDGRSSELISCDGQCEFPPCVCDEGECTGGVCEPGSFRCTGSSLERCRGGIGWVQFADCQAEHGVSCEELDDGAQCQNVEAGCEPDELRCSQNSNSVDICVERVGFVEHERCGAAELCVDGACAEEICEPGTSTCQDGITIADCPDGTAIELIPCDLGLFCNRMSGEATCEAQRCTPDELFCEDDKTLMQCNSTGSGTLLSERCEGLSVCRDNECVPPICEPGEFRCTAEGRQVCSSSGMTWRDAPCNDEHRCLDGLCVPHVCQPNQLSCSSGRSLMRCLPDGSGTELVEVCEAACSAGACQAPICGDGIVTPSAGETCDNGSNNACSGCEACQQVNNIRVSPTTRTTSQSSWVPNNANFTFEAWVKVETRSGALFGLGDPSSRDHLLVRMANGKLEVELAVTNGSRRSSSWSLATPNELANTGWHHIAVSRFNQTGFSIMVDGRLVAYRGPENLTRSLQGNGRIWVGSYTDEGTRAGAIIGGLHLYNGLPSGTSIRPERIFSARSNTIGLWNLNESDGSSFRDSSQHGRHLTITDTQVIPDSCYDIAGALCGDGVVAPWEDCDGGPGCNSSCRYDADCDGVLAPDGTCLMVSLDGRQFSQAKSYCESWGGSLVSINSSAENSYLTELLDGRTAWIGLYTDDRNKLNSNRVFYWVDGSEGTYRNWASGEPNNGGYTFTVEQCVEITSDGKWNDLDCGSSLRFVCAK